MITSIISVDWLQIYCDLSLLNYTGEYEVKTLSYGTKHFEILEEIYTEGALFASVQRKPRSDILKSHTGIIKFQNKILYSSIAENIIQNFLSLCEITILSITRIDIAIDFREFENRMKPENLIKGFMTEKYLKNGRGKYTIIGSQKNVLDVSYLRFGTKSSDVNVYLYNKTLEMNEQTYKEYITESWQDLAGSPMQPVWRLEFSLKAKATSYLDEETGEIETIDLSFLSNFEMKKRVCQALINRYFEFKVRDKQKNKSRMRTLILFNLDNTTMTNRYFPKGSDILKKDKILMKNIYTLNLEHRNIPEAVTEAQEQVLSFMRESSFLDNYFKKKETDWKKIDFRV